MKSILLCFCFICLIYNISSGLSEDLNNIPNANYLKIGQKSRCQICHDYRQPIASDPGTTGLNQFGLDYQTCGKSWNSCLGEKDSDGDKYINKIELNCDNYNWAAYSSTCGSCPTCASNPGDAEITPPISVEKRYDHIDETTAYIKAVPNPFNPTTTIKFNLLKSASMSLDILASSGKVIRTFSLTSNELKNSSVEWNGKDDGGRTASAGIYIARLKTGEKILSTRLFLSH